MSLQERRPDVKTPRQWHKLLISGFCAIVFGVPALQVAFEVVEGKPVQATDLFRSVPTREQLRRFEQTLEDAWWGQSTLRPLTQQALCVTLHDVGSKVLRGRDGWLFYRPAVEYLATCDRVAWSSGERDLVAGTNQASVVRAIVQFRDQLQARGIHLLVVPVPAKASIYPDRLTRRFLGKAGAFRSPTETLLEELDRQGVATVNLFSAFRQARRREEASVAGELFLEQDTHWTPHGAAVAARAVAEVMSRRDGVVELPFAYSTEQVEVARVGDLVEMIGVPGSCAGGRPQLVRCRRVLDPIVGPLMPPGGGRPGRFKNDHLLDTPMESRILLLGDSYSRIYQTLEPASLGTVGGAVSRSSGGVAEHGSGAPQAETSSGERVKRRALPGTAGFPSQLALKLQAPLDFIISDGGAATQVRQRLSTDGEMLDHKRLVIWEFTERDIHLGAAGWTNIPLPPVP